MPLPSSGIIVVEKPSGNIKAAGTVSHKLQNRSQQQQAHQHQHQHVVSAAASSLSSIKLTTSSASSNSTTTLSTTSPYIEYNESNNVRIQQHQTQQTEQLQIQQQRTQFQYQKSSAYAQQQNAFIEQICNNSSGSCNTSGGAVSTTALKQQRRQNFNFINTNNSSSAISSSISSCKKNPTNNCYNLGIKNSASTSYSSKTGVLSGTGSNNATALNAATSGIHKIQLKAQSSLAQKKQSQTQTLSQSQSQSQPKSQPQNQPQLQIQPQLIQVSEELYEQAVNNSCDVGDAVNGSKSNMILSTTSEMINQQQVYKIVAADGTTSNMIIDNLGNVTPAVSGGGGGGVAVSSGAAANVVVNSTATVAAAPSNTSKVLLGNLTVLSKHHHINNAVTTAASISTPSISSISCSTSATGQQQHQQQQQQHPQTINFVSAKNLSYLATVASASGAGSTTTSVTTSYGSIAANPNSKQKFALSSNTYKNNSKQHQQTSSSTATTFLLQQQQKFSTSGTAATVPVSVTTRPVQMMTRVQTLMQPSSSVAGSSVLQQQQQPQQILLPHSQTKHLTSSNKLQNSNNNANSLIATGNNFKKTSITPGNLKMSSTNKLSTLATGSSVMHHTTVAAGSGLGVKTAFIPQQQQQHQHYPSTNSLIGSAANSSSGIGTGIGIGSGNITKTKSSSKLIKQYNNAINTYTINQQKFNNTNSQQQQQNATSTTKITKVSNKYILHQPQSQAQTQQTHSGHLQQHIVNLPHGTQLQHKGVLPTSVAASQNHFNSSTSISSGSASSTTIYQHLGGGSNSSTGSNAAIAPTGTIKFVNAHGTVIQQHPGTQTLALHSHAPTSAVTTTTATVASLSAATIAPATSTLTPSPSSSSSSSATTPLFADDIVIVNGTQMTDELSARILQSMSQKSFSNSQHRYQQQQQKLSTVAGSGSAGGNMPPPTTNILLAPKEYQLYNPVQSTTPNVAVSQHQSSLLSPSIVPTSCISSPVSPFMQQHSAVVSSTASSFVTSGSSGTMGPMPASPVSISYVATPSSLVTSVTSANSCRQVYSAPGSRSHSTERKFSEGSMTRKNLDSYKISNNSLPGSTARCTTTPGTINSMSSAPMEQQSFQPILPQQHQPHTQVIHLQTLKTTSSTTMTSSLPTSVAMQSSIASAANDDDIIGEEIRPVPVITQDVRLQILHAVLSDHTYANAMPARLPTDFNVQQMLLQQQQQAGIATLSTMATGNNTNLLNRVVGSNSSNSNVSQYVASLSATSIANMSASPTAAVTTQQWALGSTTSSVATMPNSQSQQQLVHSSYTTIYGQSIPRLQQQDDDAHSAISSGSRAALGDIDPGEETETAPEAEAEDDSITRCICDLTHDDGYMICCDKCSAWQHVDCMGIDRSNIPDEYLCELCQPRAVKKSRARALQILKRKQQSQAVLSVQANSAGNPAMGGILAGVGLLSYDSYLNSQQRLGGLASSSGAGSSSNLSNLSASDGALHTLSNAALGMAGNAPYLSGNSYTTKKSKFLKKTKDLAVGSSILSASGRKSKKAEKLAAAASAAGSGCVGNINSPNAAGKSLRKETRKNTKRKTKTSISGGDTNSIGGPGANTAAGKHAANLRHWIENYELAVTNHYSPELRARLHAITKQPSLLQSIINTENKALKDCGNLENRATTVPHAGGKILISNLDIGPNYPIFELRGKYMLTTQYKTQNPSVNMNTPPPSNYQLIASHKAHKTPGPFIFFYQLPGAEAPMQTMNPDGSYPPVPPQPAYLKGPEVCVDTRTYGNEARFVRRSCRPNAEIQHLFEKGTIHLFLVSLTTIRASTEITIRHEPHDIQAVESRKSNALIVKPTSTACACGLTNDCLFGPPLPKLPPSAAKPGRKSAQLRSDKKAFQSSAALQLTSCTTAGGLSSGPAGTAGKKKSAQNLNRNRSTSSSGDSNMGSAAGFQSPNISQMHLGGTIMVGGATSNSNLKTMSLNNMAPNSNILALAGCGNSTSSMHDSGICTSSSSPSVSIPSPTPQHIHSPTQQQQQTSVLQRTLIMQQQNPQHQQMLASLPATMLLTPQLPQQQTQQPLAVMAAAAAAQLPVDIVNPDNNNDNSSLSEQQPQQIQQLSQYSEKSVPSQQQSNVDTTLAAAAALQSLNSVTDPAEGMDTQPPSEIPETEPEEKEASSQNKAQPAELSESLDSSLPQSAQKRQRNISMSAQQRHIPNKSSQGSIPPVQSNDTSNSNIDSSTASASTPLKGAQKQQQLSTGSGRKASSATKHGRNANDAISTTSNGTDPPHEYKNSDTSNNEITTVPATTPMAHSSASTSGAALTSTPKEKPKLSREDRKMEAILRAIEKMERTQQRKKEAKASKGIGKRRQNEASKRATANSSGELTDAPNVSSSSSVNQTVKRTTHATRKKKRKTSKSYGSANGVQRKRHKSRISSNDSDADEDADCAAVTSESEGTSLLSPNLTLASHLPTKASATESTKMETQQPQTVDQAAGLLMALASQNAENKSAPVALDSSFKSPQRGTAVSANVTGTPHSGTSDAAASPPPTPPAPVSSACLLIEAAVAPLDAFVGADPEFKYPSKAKTKKSLMSNWLHQSEAEASQHANTADNGSSTVGLESLVQAAMCDFNTADQKTQQTNTVGPKEDLPQNLSVAALKVEEFIYQTERSSSPMGEIAHKAVSQQQLSTMYTLDDQQCNAIEQQHQPSMNNDFSANANNEILLNSASMQSAAVRNLHLPLHQVSTCSNNSSVKKRWLRQAISEETDDTSVTSSPLNALTPQSASPAGASCLMIPNGFTTPLKKRRLLINNEEEEIESDGGGSHHLQTNESTTPTNEQQEPDIPKASDYGKREYHLSTTSNESLILNVKSEDELDIEDENNEEDDAEAENEIVDVGSELQHQTELAGSHSSRNAEIKVEQIENVPSPQPQPRTKAASKQFQDSAIPEEPRHEIKPDLSHLTDQDDDVDILRSPSPGQKIVAEDNLVKIEPEDVSGSEDVKIDVEREESLATDNFEEIVSGIKTKKEQQDGVNNENKPLFIKDEDVKSDAVMDKKCKRPTSPSVDDEHSDTKFPTMEEKPDKKDLKLALKKEDPNQHKSPKKSKIEATNEHDEPMEKKPRLFEKSSPYMLEDKDQAGTSSSQSSNLIGRLQLSDDDIQDRLSLFHEENILLLQTRNKQQSEAATANENDCGNAAVQKPASPDYNKFELDTVKPSPPSPSLQHHPYSDVPLISSTSVTKNTSSSKHANKQSSSSTYSSSHASSSVKKAHKRDRERGRDRDRERDRDYRDRDRDRERSRQRERGRQRERSRSYDRSRDRERGRSYNRSYDRDRDRDRDREFRVSRDRSYDRNRSHDRSYEYSHDHSRDRSYERNRSRDHSRERSRERGGSNSYYYSNKISGTNTATSYSSSGGSHNSYTGHYSSSSSGTTHSTPTTSSYPTTKKGTQSTSSSKSSKKALSSSASNSLATSSVASSSTEKNRYRTTSSSSTGCSTNTALGTQSGSNATITSTVSISGNRKRLNFEQENTQNSGKYHRRDDRQKEYKDDSSSTATGASSSSSSKRRLREDGSQRALHGTQRSLSSSSTSTPAPVSAPAVCAPVTATSNSCSPVYPIPVISSGTVPKAVPLVEPMQAQQLTSVHVTYPPPQTLRIVREHPTIPHFNNPLTVISPAQDVYPTSAKTSTYSENIMTTLAPTTSVFGTSVATTNSLSTFENHSTLTSTPLSSTNSFSAPFNNQQTTPTSQLPFYNTVYGKLLDQIATPVMLPASNVAGSTTTQVATEENISSSAISSSQQAVLSNSIGGVSNVEQPTSSNAITAATTSTDVGVSNYFDAKMKGYSTLSGYVSHSALFGLGNTPKLGSSSSNSGNIGGHAAAGFGGTNETTTTFNSLDNVIPSSSSTSVTLGKYSMLTKTASHDPRLNPILSAPEPPSVPKRKLSINEYRRRMKQSSSSSSSIESSNSTVTTPTTPDVPSTAANTSGKQTTMITTAPLTSSSSFFEDAGGCTKAISLAALTAPTINRCTLNSPERLDSSSSNKSANVAQRGIHTQNALEKNTTANSAISVKGGIHVGLGSPPSNTRTSIDEDLKKGQFNAAPTLLEKQQEKLCERLKSLKNQQLKASPNVSIESGRKSSSSFLLERTSMLHQVNNISSANNILENCFEAISSTSTSLESSRTPSPDHSFATKRDKKNEKEKDVAQKQQPSTTTTITAATVHTENDTNATNTNATSKQQ